MRDPRLPQILALSTLLGWGCLALDFAVRPVNVVAILLSAQAVQFIGDRAVGRRYDPRSPLISALSLCLLLRTNSVLVAVFAAAVAIGSKYLVRVRGKHLFNPAMVGLVAAVGLTEHAWVSPGQWGSQTITALFFVCAGLTVVRGADRSDVTLAFLGAFSALLVGRSLWLSEPVAIPVHRLQSGALLLFAFFMISDPKTTPDTRLGRIGYAIAVALAAYGIRFGLHRPNAVIWALFSLSWLVPVFDALGTRRTAEDQSISLPKQPLATAV